MNRQAGEPPTARSDTEEPIGVSVSGPAAVIILAAGEGTRMKAPVPKMLHEVCGRAMLGHVIDAARQLHPERLIVVIGHGGGQVADYLAVHAPEVVTVVQERRGGTGHAVRMAIEQVGPIAGTVVVTYSDTPLLRGETLAELVRGHQRAGAAVTALTALAPDPAGYGRIIRDDDGAFASIVEDADATPQQRQIREINSGMYAFDGALLADAIKRVPTDNAKGEEYLTDVAAIARADGHRVATVACADFDEVLGVNDQVQLARARRLMNQRLLGSWMGVGVTVVDPASTWVDVGVTLAAGARIEPGTQLEGRTAVAAGAHIGPGCLLRDTTVAAGATVIQSVCESAVVGAGVSVGPFAHLTPGTTVAGDGRPAGISAADTSASPARHPEGEQHQ
ncbi:MAG: bifunctional N-acetylglucosamine-1-phosphate uridyltransferase/glucosamine-1-phosphate acetyltransferase [Streptosporangiaceae bacterium]